MHKQLGLTKLGIFILIVHLFIINQGLAADVYNPFTSLRTGRRLNGDNHETITSAPHNFFLNDDNLNFSTSKSPIDTSDKLVNNSLTHFNTFINNQSSNRPRTRSASLNLPNVLNNNNELNSRSRNNIPIDMRQNNQMSDIIPILAHLINLKPSNRPNSALINNHIPIANQLPPNFLNPQMMNNPGFRAFLQNYISNNGHLQNGGIIVPSSQNRQPILPLHFNKQQPQINNRPLVLNQHLNQLFNNKQGLPSNLTSLPINNLINNFLTNNNQSLDQILPTGVLNKNSYTRVESAEVSKLLLGSNLNYQNRPTIKNEILFSSVITPSSTASIADNSIDSLHFPNELFSRTSISRPLNENTHNLNPTRSFDQQPNSKFIDNMFDYQSNATVISNNHNKNMKNDKLFNRNQLASSFPPVYTSQPTIQPTNQLNTNQLLSNQLNNEANQPSTTTNWQSFEMFNTNQNLIKPTRLWDGKAPEIITKPEEANTFDITVRNKMGTNDSKIDNIESNIKPTAVAALQESGSTINLSSFSVSLSSASKEPEVVYGRRPVNRPNNNNNNNLLPGLVNSVSIISPSTTQGYVTSVTLDNSKSNDSIGRPIVQVYPVEMDLVKPQIATNQLPQNVSPVIITESGGGSVYIDAQQKHFKLKPVQKTSTIPAMQIGSTMNVFGNNGDNNNLNAFNKPGSSINTLNPFSNLTNSNDKIRPNQVRRPIFRPKSSTPLVRIDTCIVGDESTCGANLNEHCKTEFGISSCHCKPGFGRHTQRGLCIPTTSLVMSLKLDKLGENKLQFSKNLLNSDSEEFQYLEFESIQAINSLFQMSRLSKLFLGVHVNKFYPVQGKTMLNATVVLERNNITRANTIKKQLQQELSRVINAKNNALGDSQLLVDSVALPRLDDVNECADPALNDCSRNAKCINELGTFSCVCRPGFEDRYALASKLAESNSHQSSALISNSQSNNLSQNKNLNMKLGRVCLGCSPAYCSNRGECSIVNGEKLCKCKGNFIGSRCDLDAEILAVAFGGSLAALIIIIITILCLYVWNQKWKNEAQKMEAMSSNSGQTFSYVNKPTNTTSFRFGMNGWNSFEPATLQNNASNYNYYVNPEQILVSTSQHVYATPNRDREEIVHTPDQLLDDETNNHFYNTRRSKSRNCSSSYQPATIYNEAEFSTRKTLYTPSHLIIGSSRPKYAMY